MADVNFETLKVSVEEDVCRVQIFRPEANNAINGRLIADLVSVLAECESAVKIVILSGLPEVFCSGADFAAVADADGDAGANGSSPEVLYDLWSNLATGPYVTICDVKGRVNAGGIGFVAASDIVLADESAQFSLSELLFGLLPACVMPFLVRRVGFQRAQYLTLMTHPVDVATAHSWGLVDAHGARSDVLLRRHLQRLRRLSKRAIRRYKDYAKRLSGGLMSAKAAAVEMNRVVFSDEENLRALVRYTQQGVFPWESDHT